MKRHWFRLGWFRTLMISAVLLALSPTPSSAQCGWILWLKITRLEVDRDSRGAIEPGQWEPRQGFALFQECRAAMVGERKSHQDFQLPVAGGGSLSYTYEVACFPGAFDPRPRPKSN